MTPGIGECERTIWVREAEGKNIGWMMHNLDFEVEKRMMTEGIQVRNLSYPCPCLDRYGDWMSTDIGTPVNS